MYLVLPLAVLALALLMFLLAWLAGHQTPIPASVRPAFFWYPGLFLLVVAAAVALTPSAIAWNRCNSECSIENNAPNREQYEKCIESSKRSIGSDLMKRDETLTEADVARYLEDNKGEIEGQCESGIMAMCVEACFSAWRDPEAAAAAAAALQP